MTLAAIIPSRWRRAAGAADPVEGALRLFVAEGFFAHYPGPVVLVPQTGDARPANAQGTELAKLLNAGRAPKIVAMVESALGDGNGRTAAVTLPSDGTLLEVTILPTGPEASPAGDCAGAASAALLLGRDATLERNLRRALIESRERYQDLVNISSDFAWETGKNGTFVFVSPRGALGYRPEELVDRNPEDLVLDQPGAEDLLFTTRVALEEAECVLRRADGSHACVLISCVPIFGEAGAWEGARGVCLDVTEAREREAQLARARAREQLLAYILRQVRDEVMPDNMMRAAAEATAKAFGAAACCIYSGRGARGFAATTEFGTIPAAAPPPLARLGDENDHDVAEDEAWRVVAMTTRYRQTVNGAIALWREKAAAAWDEDDIGLLVEVAGQLGIAIEQLANHAELERLSRTDTLTGLLNRRVFLEELDRRRGHAARTGRGGALCYVDLDNFKLVNDRHGHQEGDRALVVLSRLLGKNTRVNDLVARLGGDEFAVWLEETTEAGAVAKAEALLAGAGELAAFSGDGEHPLGLSIGIAVYDPGRPEEVKALMARADAAMYAVKRAGKGGLRIESPGEASEAGPREVMEAAS